MQTAITDTPLRRGRLFIVALMALFTAGAAVSMRAATAVHMRGEYLDPIDAANAGAMLGAVLGGVLPGVRWRNLELAADRGGLTLNAEF